MRRSSPGATSATSRRRGRATPRSATVLLPVLAAKGWEVVASNATHVPLGRDPRPASTPKRSPSGCSQRGVLVSPGTFFGPSGEGYIRFALVPTLEECERAATIIEEVL